MFYRLKVAIDFANKVYQGVCIPDSWHHLTRCDVLLLIHDANRGYVFQNKLYAHLIDTLGDIFSNKGLIVNSIAIPYSVYTLDKGYNYPFSYNRINFFGQIISKNTLKIIKNFLIEPRVFYITWKSTILLKFWIQLLQEIQPKVIIGIGPDENLCQAGRLLNIPVYDLQHGFISHDDPLYGEKFQEQKKSDSLPYGFLCWDEQSASALRSWTEKQGIRVLTVGNPWFLRFVYPDTNDILIKDAMRNSHALFDGGRPSILVSLQWGLDQIYSEKGFNGVMVKALEQTIIDTLEKYNWIIRLHPVQLRGIERERMKKKLTAVFGADKAQMWLNTSTAPLPLILNKVDLHITDYSAIIKEASWMGVRSAILNSEVKTGGKFDFFIHERTIGMAERIEQDPEMIKKWISENLKKEQCPAQLKDTREIRDAFIEEVVEKCRP